MIYDAQSNWKSFFEKQQQMPFPSEGLIRVIRGHYPYLPDLPRGCKALDVGCGEGVNTAFLAGEGYEVTGLEIDEQITLSNSGRFPSLQFVTGMAEDIPFSNDSFALVVAWNSLYYQSLSGEPVESTLKEFARIIEPGGG